jgi:hypothetical protein
LEDKCAGGEFWNVMHLLLQNIKEKSDIAPKTPAVICFQTDDSNSADIFRVLQLRAVPPMRVSTADDEGRF